MTGSEKSNLKQKIEEEICHFFLYFIFFALFLTSLTLYRRLILAEYAISYFHYGYALIEAMILSKVILLGQRFNLGNQFSNCSLIIPTLYNAFIFTLFAAVFSTVEHFLTGFLHGRSFYITFEKFIDQGIDEVLASLLIIFLVFILFFAFLEIGKVIGTEKLFKLFFNRSSLDKTEKK